MINANELRIGNWVGGNFPNMIVRSINKHDVEIDMPGSEADCFDATTEELEPIELTGEILEWCGFEWIPSVNFAGWFAPIQNDWRIRIWEDDEGFYVYSLNDYRAMRIFYLHQLQNLYFALTGTELVFSDVLKMVK